MSLTTSGSPEIALADQGVEVEPVALPARAQIKHRREIERDADAGKLSALAPAIGLGLRLALIRRHGRKCRQRRLLRQRRRQMRDDAALLVGRNNQRRQMGRGARGLQAGDLGLDVRGRPAGDIVPGHVDAGDQALAGQRGGFRRIVVADHEMASEQARNRSLGVQRLVFADRENGLRRDERHKRHAPCDEQDLLRDAVTPGAAANHSSAHADCRKHQRDMATAAQLHQIRLIAINGDKNEKQRKRQQHHKADTSEHAVHRPQEVRWIATDKARRVAPDTESRLHKICKQILKACASPPARLHRAPPWSVHQRRTMRGRAIMSDYAAPAVRAAPITNACPSYCWPSASQRWPTRCSTISA